MKFDPWGAAFVVIALVAGGMVLSQDRPQPQVDISSAAAGRMCERDITKFVPFKDPSSVQVMSVRAEKTAGQFTLQVRAKNSFGAYGDPTFCSCGVAGTGVTAMHCDSPSGI